MSILRNFVDRLKQSEVSTEISESDKMRFTFHGLTLPTTFDASWLRDDDASNNSKMMYDIVIKDKMRALGSVNVNFRGKR